MNRTVRELTRAIASGDTEAFAQLYETHFDPMLRDARRFTGRDESFCLDIVQDSMMKVIRCIKPIDTEAGLRAWLRCVVKSCAYDSLRREARRAHHERNTVRESCASTDECELADRLHWLRMQLQQLDPSSRDLVLLRHRLGWTLQRIGAMVGLSPGAVDGRLSRTMRKLQNEAEHIDE